jgi:hypothetical protein
MMFELLLDVMDRACEIPTLNAPDSGPEHVALY